MEKFEFIKGTEPDYELTGDKALKELDRVYNEVREAVKAGKAIAVSSTKRTKEGITDHVIRCQL